MNKNNEELRIIPYTATSLSVVGRFIFMFLLYKNKSTNSLSSAVYIIRNKVKQYYEQFQILP